MPRASTTAPSGLRAALLVGRLALTELARARLLPIVVLVAGGIALGALALRDLHLGAAELRLVLDLGFGAASLGGTLLAVLGTSHLVLGDLDRRTAVLVLARPIPRAAWLVGKLGGVLAGLGAYVGVVTALTLVVASHRAGVLGVELPGREIALGGLVLWLRAGVIAAGTLFVCTWARTALWANGVALAGVLIGHLRPVVEGRPVEATWDGVLAGLLRAWPNLQLFEPGSTAPGGAGLLVAYGGVYVVLFTVAAVLAFRHREL